MKHRVKLKLKILLNQSKIKSRLFKGYLFYINIHPNDEVFYPDLSNYNRLDYEIAVRPQEDKYSLLRPWLYIPGGFSDKIGQLITIS